MRTVLVIDDNPAVAQALSLLFGLHDIRTLTAFTPQKGLAALAHERVDLVIADMNFSADTTSGEEGAVLFRALRTQQPDLPVVLLTAWTHLESAVQLVKAGAADYIGKPWDNDKLLATVENLLELAETTREHQRLQDEQRRRRERLAEQYDLCNIVFASDAMERVVELACRVARADVRVLITGPNGAGKERIAQIVHANSALRAGPFVAVNCGAIPSELIEAELFGAEAGAYTGANRARTGRFEAANGGTLFLDEIGDLPLAGQVKLLRVLETGQFEMLGSSKTRTAQVRILSATNADLPALIREGRFREDLYYRLNVIDIAVPPLAERPATSSNGTSRSPAPTMRCSKAMASYGRSSKARSQDPAAACRKPVVSTSLPTGVSTVNQHGVTGLLVPPGDAQALAASLKQLLDSDSLRQEMGEAGRSRVEAEFTSARMAAGILEIYRSLNN